MKSYLARVITAVIISLAFSSGTWATERPDVLTVAIPAYPAIAAAKRISGVVLVDVEINAEGNVTAANTITGHELLRNAAKVAALEWHFKPVADSKNHSIRLTFIFHDVSYVAPKKKPEFTSPYQVEIEWNPVID